MSGGPVVDDVFACFDHPQSLGVVSIRGHHVRICRCWSTKLQLHIRHGPLTGPYIYRPAKLDHPRSLWVVCIVGWSMVVIRGSIVSVIHKSCVSVYSVALLESAYFGPFRVRAGGFEPRKGEGQGEPPPKKKHLIAWIGQILQLSNDSDLSLFPMTHPPCQSLACLDHPQSLLRDHHVCIGYARGGASGSAPPPASTLAEFAPPPTRIWA